MFIQFLKLEIKSFFRSASFGQSLALKIFMGFLGVYFLLSFLLLGFALYPILEGIEGDKSPLQIFNSFVIIWLVAELFMRFMLQTLPVMNIRPMLINPIKRKTTIHFVLIKSLFSFYNFLTPLMIIPFSIICMIEGENSVIGMLGWMISMLSLVVMVNYLNFIIKKKFSENFKGLIPYLIIGLLLFALEYFQVFKTTEFVALGLDQILNYPILTLIPILGVIGLYYWNFNYLKNNFYLDSSLKNKSSQANDYDLSWTNRFGSIAPFLTLDLRLILRNKRPRSTVIMSLIFAAYGLIIYSIDTYDNDFMKVFVGIFMTGIFTLNFGQFIPGWDSGYYSMMMSQNIPMKQYLASKAGLMYFSILVMSLLTLPYMYFGVEVLILNLGCALYNLGVNIPIILFMGSFNKKRIDLDKSPFMNYQGTGGAQWITALPVILLPLLIWVLVNWLSSGIIASITIGVIGIIAFIAKDPILNLILKSYKKNKYVMIAGFKQQEN